MVVPVVVVNIVGHFGEEECRAFFDGVVEECWCWQCTASHFDPCLHLGTEFPLSRIFEVACPLISRVGVKLSKSKGSWGEGALGCSANTVPSNPFDSTL